MTRLLLLLLAASACDGGDATPLIVGQYRGDASVVLSPDGSDARTLVASDLLVDITDTSGDGDEIDVQIKIHAGRAPSLECLLFATDGDDTAELLAQHNPYCEVQEADEDEPVVFTMYQMTGEARRVDDGLSVQVLGRYDTNSDTAERGGASVSLIGGLGP